MRIKTEKIIFILLIGFEFIHLLISILVNHKIYFQKFDEHKYDIIYEHSQYNVAKNEFWGNIDDPQLYSLSGLKYIRLSDPSSINFELQPLTKYFFGISILLFGNALWFQLMIGLTLLFGTYVYSLTVFKNKLIALLPSLILSLDPLFGEQLQKSFLDLTQTAILMLVLILTINMIKNLRLIPLNIMAIALLSLSKSFMIGLVVLFTVAIFLFFGHREVFLIWIKKLFLGVLLYIFGYAVYFYYHTPFDFIRLHINILRLYKAYVPEYPKGEIFRIVFLRLWKKWYADFGFTPVDQWWIFWPVSLIAYPYAIFTLLRKTSPEVILAVCWILVYLMVISSRLVFPRYLLPALPCLYIILVYTLQKVAEVLYVHYTRDRDHI